MSLHTTLGTALLTLATTVATAQTNTGRPATPIGETRAAPAEQQIGQLLTALQDAKAEALWNHLPASYRSEVEQLMQLLGERVDADVYEQSMRLVARFAEVGTEKRELFFATPLVLRIMAADPERDTQRKIAYDAVLRILQHISTGPLHTVDGLQTFDGHDFAKLSGSQLLRSLFAIAKAQGIDSAATLANVQIETVRQQGDRATLLLKWPHEEATNRTFACVEGRWLPESLVSGWGQGMKRARAALEAMPETTDKRTMARVRVFLDVMNGIVDRLAEAETQEEFDAALMQVMALDQQGRQRRTK